MIDNKDANSYMFKSSECFVDKQKVGGCGSKKGHILPKGSALDPSVLLPLSPPLRYLIKS